VSRFRSSHHCAACSFANFGIEDTRACTHKSPSHVRFRANRTIWVRGKESALLLTAYGERYAAVTTPR
jgi:hypothetical protein